MLNSLRSPRSLRFATLIHFNFNNPLPVTFPQVPAGAFQNPVIKNTHANPPLQPHSAPLGLTFYFGDMFPEEYQSDLFVAYHGSWNRKEPTGYKIVTIDMNDLEVNDFATGWLKEAMYWEGRWTLS